MCKMSFKHKDQWVLEKRVCNENNRSWKYSSGRMQCFMQKRGKRHDIKHINKVPKNTLEILKLGYSISHPLQDILRPWKRWMNPSKSSFHDTRWKVSIELWIKWTNVITDTIRNSLTL